MSNVTSIIIIIYLIEVYWINNDFFYLTSHDLKYSYMFNSIFKHHCSCLDKYKDRCGMHAS